jgi:hypothetical protein
MSEVTTGIRAENLIKSTELESFRSTAAKALKMAGVLESKSEEGGALNPETAKLIDAMIPFMFDHGSRKVLPAVVPLPTPDEIAIEGLRYINEELPPIPVLSSAVLPYIIGADKRLVSIDGTGVYSHNEISGLEADRALRRLLTTLVDAHTKTNSEVVARFSGDLFVIVSQDEGQESILPQVRRHLESIESGRNFAWERNFLASFRRGENGQIVLDIARMHVSDPQITKQQIERPKPNESLTKRISRLKANHPELDNLIKLIQAEPLGSRGVLLGIVESSLYDRLLQGVAEKNSTDDFRVRVFTDSEDFTEHLTKNNIKLGKLDIASVLKTANGEPGFGEKAGDALLICVFEMMVNQIKVKFPDINEVSVMRRWGDYFFADNLENLQSIGKELLMRFKRTPYAVIRPKPGKTEEFTVKFVDRPPEVQPGEKMLIIPLMPMFAVDREINIVPIDPGTDKATAVMMKDLNDRQMGTRMKVIDDSLRHTRGRIILEFLENATAPLVDFLLFKSFNPQDKKRGLPRLRGDWKASEDQIENLLQLQQQVVKDLAPENAAKMSERVAIMPVSLMNRIVGAFHRLAANVVKGQSFHRIENGVEILTYETVKAMDEDTDRLLARTEPRAKTESPRLPTAKLGLPPRKNLRWEEV